MILNYFGFVSGFIKLCYYGIHIGTFRSNSNQSVRMFQIDGVINNPCFMI